MIRLYFFVGLLCGLMIGYSWAGHVYKQRAIDANAWADSLASVAMAHAWANADPHATEYSKELAEDEFFEATRRLLKARTR